MHPDRGILRRYRRLDGLSTRPDKQNTPNLQSADTNDTIRDLLHDPIKWNPARFTDTLRLQLRLRLLLWALASLTPSQSQQALHRCVKIPTIV